MDRKSDDQGRTDMKFVQPPKFVFGFSRTINGVGNFYDAQMPSRLRSQGQSSSVSLVRTLGLQRAKAVTKRQNGSIDRPRR